MKGIIVAGVTMVYCFALESAVIEGFETGMPALLTFGYGAFLLWVSTREEWRR